ncbi:MAG: glycine--tRNA ligase subunit alpha [Acidobacteriota bacterium]
MEDTPVMTDEPDGEAVQALALQDAVLRLQRFWVSKGCLRLPPCDFAAPFATLHPDAFFRILGGEPWHVAYVQPVRRPLDGRYGKHPYRLAKHHQLEVVLKPPPADVRSLYLESLECLGFDLSLHDLRFAEWTWEPRSLGARGAGWHAMVDGLGITRLTFLDRLADRDLEPATLELSYGLERLLMVLQNVDSAYAIDWSNDGTDYGRLRRRDEEETSRYVCEIADVESLRRRLEAMDREAERCLEAGLAHAAYEQAVRCLEPIDILEARGAMTARERRHWLDTIRQRVSGAADLFSTAPEPAVEIEPAKPEEASTAPPAASTESPAEPAAPAVGAASEEPQEPSGRRRAAKSPSKRSERKKPARKRPEAKRPEAKRPEAKRPEAKRPARKKPARKPRRRKSAMEKEADE